MKDETIIIKMGKGYVIFDAVCVIIFILFFLMSAYYSVTSGVLFFFVCTIGAVFNFLDRKTRRIIVENDTIIEKRMLRKQKRIKFNDVDYFTLVEGNNTVIIVIRSNTGITIKIPRCYQNVEMFESMMFKQYWILK